MAKLDVAWAIEQIDKFLYTTQQVAYDNRPGSGVVVVGTHMRGSSTEAAQLAHVVEQILDRALKGWDRERPKKDAEHAWLREQAGRARAALARQEELVEKLGDNAPDMDAANLHPWVWEAARSLWNSGHFHQAVMQASMKVNSETQGKLSRFDISETDLFNQAFNTKEPKPGEARLRLMEDNVSKTYESLHRGARSFAEGLFAGIRNPGMHVPHDGGGDEQLALEQLAAFSLLARWVDQATVVSQ
ncbi:MAG: TIGR02391 family protein [Ornithinimicrobium sp.]